VSGRLGVVSSGSGVGFTISRREVAAAEDVTGRGCDWEGEGGARMALLQSEWAVAADGPRPAKQMSGSLRVSARALN
jgi:hypothetical protein